MLKLLLATLLAIAPVKVQPDPFTPLAVYSGSWTLLAQHPFGDGPAGKPESLVSHCHSDQAFYTCEQVVDGKPAELIVYVAGDAPGKYHTQMVLPMGFATGRGNLTIVGDHWTYDSIAIGGSKYYRTENYFKGPDSIHFEEYESTDGKAWTKTNEGDESRQRP
jgi:hypothetical protein